MSGTLLNELRRGFYADSVVLMRLSRALAQLPGVLEAAMMMATPANKEILRDARLLNDDSAGAANDLIIAVRAHTEDAARAALAEAGAELARPRSAAGEFGAAILTRNLRAGLRFLPDASLALISVPGDFAIAEARKAIRSGLDVMIFSDNVAIEDEVAIKSEARTLGRLVMGPDCGTAILNGHPLAFANQVPIGEIGIIGASGTGMQEVTSLIAQNGRGVSQAIGVGGRDLNQQVGGIMTLMAIDLLDADPQTKHVVLISKPPHADVAKAVLERVAKSLKSFTICFLGSAKVDVPKNAKSVETLTAAAEHALHGLTIGADGTPPASFHPKPGVIVGLYSGGTLCAEAQLVLLQRGRKVTSNAPVPAAARLPAGKSQSDRLLDLGADEYTRGRPHPMIDPAAREQLLRKTLTDRSVSTILLDVVIGFGAHADPAAGIAAVLAAAPSGRPHVIASIVGTEQDPQIRSRQISSLEQAGVLVARSNAHAAALAVALSKH